MEVLQIYMLIRGRGSLTKTAVYDSFSKENVPEKLVKPAVDEGFILL